MFWALLKEAEGGSVSSNGCNKENGRLPEEDKPGGTEPTCEQVNKSTVGDSLSFPLR